VADPRVGAALEQLVVRRVDGLGAGRLPELEPVVGPRHEVTPGVADSPARSAIRVGAKKKAGSGPARGSVATGVWSQWVPPTIKLVVRLSPQRAWTAATTSRLPARST
jgi:hypothetical protein